MEAVAAASATPVPRRIRDRLRRIPERLTPARLRFWGLLVIHLAAFAGLYLAAFELLERAAAEAGATAARFQLDAAVRRLPFLWMGERPHALADLGDAHDSIGLRLYRRDGTVVNAGGISPDPAELARVRAFLAGSESAVSWVADERERQWVRGAVRISAGSQCTPCHDAGSTLGAATMKIDFTAPFAAIRRRLRDRSALLVGGWLVLLGLVTLGVQRSVGRAGERLRAELAAAAGAEATSRADGGGGDEGGADVVGALDPVTAEVHRNLREWVRRQRERESQVATRLAHVDQLASLGQLAAGLAHEIKNPLAGIQGALEVLRDESGRKPGEESATRLYDEMLAELARVNGTLGRLLESGRAAPLRRARTDLARLLADVVELLRPSLRRQGVRLRAETGAALPEVEVDGAKLRQVLVNLVQNAAEAMSGRQGNVTVRASGFAAESAVVLTVEDDGPGIDREHLGRLFEPFFTTKLAGTGLGLAISKSLVEQHGGRIEVSSEPGRGTTFLIVLPQEAGGAAARAVAGSG